MGEEEEAAEGDAKRIGGRGKHQLRGVHDRKAGRQGLTCVDLQGERGGGGSGSGRRRRWARGRRKAEGGQGSGGRKADRRRGDKRRTGMAMVSPRFRWESLDGWLCGCLRLFLSLLSRVHTTWARRMLGLNVCMGWTGCKPNEPTERLELGS